MKVNSDRSLKSLNMKWLVMLAVFDMLVVFLFIAPGVIDTTSLSQLTIARGLATTVLPVVLLLITGVLSHDAKAILVYWKIRNVMPGCQAFTKYGSSDLRIDMTALKKNVGVLPTEPTEQNSKWFKLYQMVKTDPAVIEAHKLYLMYRDMAAMSLPLIVLGPLGLFVSGASSVVLWTAAGLFFLQFLVSAVAARNSGVRFVCNVLAIHATKKVTTPSVH